MFGKTKFSLLWPWEVGLNWWQVFFLRALFLLFRVKYFATNSQESWQKVEYIPILFLKRRFWKNAFTITQIWDVKNNFVQFLMFFFSIRAFFAKQKHFFSGVLKHKLLLHLGVSNLKEIATKSDKSVKSHFDNKLRVIHKLHHLRGGQRGYEKWKFELMFLT